MKGASDLLKLDLSWDICTCACMCLLRRNRDKKDDIYLEVSLFDLRQKYGGTDSGRQETKIRVSKFLQCLKVWTSTCHMRRDYIEKITRGQKGRAHPEKQVPSFDDSFASEIPWNSSELLVNSHASLVSKASKSMFHFCIWQFRNDPDMRLYKIFQHTERKSRTGLIDT